MKDYINKNVLIMIRVIKLSRIVDEFLGCRVWEGEDIVISIVNFFF